MTKVSNRSELVKLINETMEEQGSECDLNFIDVSEITDMDSLFRREKFNGDFWMECV